MNNKGFTLLEMVVVVIIISILFLLTIPNISKVIASVDSKACKAQTKVIDAAIVQFRLDYGSEPSSLMDLVNGGYLEEEQITCSNGQSLSIVDGHCVIY
ncbi:MAG: prepilin-type N-terminal cleavage/methylation domain-containing protein [Erysipelotrichaceae bacterium]|nr:prepilin-type N-terminal cleavage/methylation domain-containing protein [Erysipelotrichaceae bacterium]MBQ6217387.1 prepilin-type N-terminal cleavage/methylation domain-containing protein [Erysipelotrichaceae bacterium]MBR6232857.1 prepilin-type N-terminal cleavage/methylation domain-containing protein [Erysipelotrichaceae bacterium]